QVVDLVRALRREVGLVGCGDVAGRDAALDGVYVNEQCHAPSKPPARLTGRLTRGARQASAAAATVFGRPSSAAQPSRSYDDFSRSRRKTNRFIAGSGDAAAPNRARSRRSRDGGTV